MTDLFPVPWAYGRHTAHLMRFQGDGVWRSVCAYRVTRGWRHIGWSSDALPQARWCLRCRLTAVSTVAGYAATGLVNLEELARHARR